MGWAAEVMVRPGAIRDGLGVGRNLVLNLPGSRACRPSHNISVAVKMKRLRSRRCDANSHDGRRRTGRKRS